jgi:hypothetical protein
MIIKNKTNVTRKIFEDNKVSIKYNKIINKNCNLGVVDNRKSMKNK